MLSIEQGALRPGTFVVYLVIGRNITIMITATSALKSPRDLPLVENYDRAMMDTTCTWVLHHRDETTLNKTRRQLWEDGAYYGLSPDKLIALHPSIHSFVHRHRRYPSPKEEADTITLWLNNKILEAKERVLNPEVRADHEDKRIRTTSSGLFKDFQSQYEKDVVLSKMDITPVKSSFKLAKTEVETYTPKPSRRRKVERRTNHMYDTIPEDEFNRRNKALQAWIDELYAQPLDVDYKLLGRILNLNLDEL